MSDEKTTPPPAEQPMPPLAGDSPESPEGGLRPAPLTARERRRRILLLVLLLVLLALLVFGLWYWNARRSAPVPRLTRDEDFVAPPEYLYSITGEGENVLDRPVGVDVAADGRVYVVDFGKRRVSVFTRGGRFLFSFNEVDGGEVLGNPVHLQVKGDEVWVTDRRLRDIFIFDLDGTFVRRFERLDEDEGEWTPLALAFDPEGQLRVTDVGATDKHQLLYYTEEGSRTAAVGRTQQVNKVEDLPGAFFFPNGLAVADDGRVYVADGDNRRVQVFDERAAFEYFVDTSGVPRGLAIDEESRLYVVDALAHTVDIYDLDGGQITQFGQRGFGPGQFNYPNDVAIDSGGRIYVSDRENDQVQVWAWPSVIPLGEFFGKVPPWVLLLPLLLLPLLLLLRKRRYVITTEFVTTLAEAGRIELLYRSRVKYVAPNEDRPLYEGRVIDGVELEEVISFEGYSDSDVQVMQDRLRSTRMEAIYLVMGDRARGVLSENIELRRLGIIIRVRVLDLQEFLDDIGERAEASSEEP